MISKVLHRATKIGNSCCACTRIIQKDNDKFQKVKSRVMFQSLCQILKQMNDIKTFPVFGTWLQAPCFPKHR